MVPPSKGIKSTLYNKPPSDLKGFKPLGARISWWEPRSWHLQELGSLSIPSFQLHPGFMAFTPFLCSSVPCRHSLSSLCLHHLVQHCFHWEPPGPAPSIWGCSVMREHGSVLKSSVWLSGATPALLLLPPLGLEELVAVVSLGNDHA